MKYFIKTYGCQMNYADSERIATILERHKFKPAEDIQEADLIVFNTCGVRQMAENRVYGQIHNLRIKNHDSGIKIILTGCLANRKDVQRRLKDKVDLFFPISELGGFENWIIGNCFEIRNSKFEIMAQKNKKLSNENISYLSVNQKHASLYQAFVPVMTGCNNFCSYCVVPYARGREVSRPAEEVIKEIKGLVKNGYKLITLLGQNVNSYNSQITRNKQQTKRKLQNTNYKNGNINFAELLKMINAIPGNFWITFLTSHPKDMSDELIKVIAQSKKICEFVHLPIQAGDDKVLQAMNRKYTAKHYLGLVAKIKKAFKKHKAEKLFAIAGDIIVGFPGENRKQFLQSAEVMKKVQYDMVYFGQFSPRPETAAWKMKDKVSNSEKDRREKYLNEILKKTSLENNQKYLGTELEILVREEKNGHYFGITRTMKNVKITGLSTTLPLTRGGRKGEVTNLVGKFINVKIIKANTWNLEGKLI